jgi:hypothetical protein
MKQLTALVSGALAWLNEIGPVSSWNLICRQLAEVAAKSLVEWDE